MKSSLRTEITKATTSSGDAAYLEAAKQMNIQANRILDEIDAKLKTGATDAAGADAVLSKITKELKGLKKQVSALAKQAKGAKEASAKAAGAKAAAGERRGREKAMDL